MVVVNVVRVVKFGIYFNICLKGFVDGLDVKSELQVFLSPWL